MPKGRPSIPVLTVCLWATAAVLTCQAQHQLSSSMGKPEECKHSTALLLIPVQK